MDSYYLELLEQGLPAEEMACRELDRRALHMNHVLDRCHVLFQFTSTNEIKMACQDGTRRTSSLPFAAPVLFLVFLPVSIFRSGITKASSRKSSFGEISNTAAASFLLLTPA